MASCGKCKMMLKTKKEYYRKLVRDGIPQKIKRKNEEYKISTLKKEELGKLLRKKLVEESIELKKTKKDGLINELADALQIIKSIADFERISFKKVEIERENKERKYGAYKKGIFLIWSSKQIRKK